MPLRRRPPRGNLLPDEFAGATARDSAYRAAAARRLLERDERISEGASRGIPGVPGRDLLGRMRGGRSISIATLTSRGPDADRRPRVGRSSTGFDIRTFERGASLDQSAPTPRTRPGAGSEGANGQGPRTRIWTRTEDRKGPRFGKRHTASRTSLTSIHEWQGGHKAGRAFLPSPFRSSLSSRPLPLPPGPRLPLPRADLPLRPDVLGVRPALVAAAPVELGYVPPRLGAATEPPVAARGEPEGVGPVRVGTAGDRALDPPGGEGRVGTGREGGGVVPRVLLAAGPLLLGGPVPVVG
ncbi:hypothetical protein THAOC_09022, partial [Thalassiosira oceanica]